MRANSLCKVLILLALLSSCKDHHVPIIDGIYDHPRDEGSYEVPDNATPIDFYRDPNEETIPYSILHHPAY
jgi:hypothetical protein